jgi:hypothetical protein
MRRALFSFVRLLIELWYHTGEQFDRVSISIMEGLN